MGFDLEQWMRSHGLDRKRAMSVLGVSKAGMHRLLHGKCGTDVSRQAMAVDGLVSQLSGLDAEAVEQLAAMARKRRQAMLGMSSGRGRPVRTAAHEALTFGFDGKGREIGVAAHGGGHVVAIGAGGSLPNPLLRVMETYRGRLVAFSAGCDADRMAEAARRRARMTGRDCRLVACSAGQGGLPDIMGGRARDLFALSGLLRFVVEGSAATESAEGRRAEAILRPLCEVFIPRMLFSLDAGAEVDFDLSFLPEGGAEAVGGSRGRDALAAVAVVAKAHFDGCEPLGSSDLLVVGHPAKPEFDLALLHAVAATAPSLPVQTLLWLPERLPHDNGRVAGFVNDCLLQGRGRNIRVWLPMQRFSGKDGELSQMAAEALEGGAATAVVLGGADIDHCGADRLSRLCGTKVARGGGLPSPVASPAVPAEAFMNMSEGDAIVLDRSARDVGRLSV